MNKKWHNALPPLVALCLGCVSGILWALMQRYCLDEKGLLLPWNLPGILSLLLSAAVVVTVLLVTRKLGGSNRYGDNFSPSIPGGAAAFAAAIGILVLMLRNLGSQRDILSSVWLVLGFLSVPALILTGVSQLKCRRPNFLLHCILCLFYSLHMANQYRIWSSDPQLANYCYPLFACVFLTMSAYCHAAFDAGMGRRLRHLIAGLLAAYFSMACIFMEGFGLFYLTGGIWAAANLCNFQPKPRRPKPEDTPPSQEDPS